MLEWDWQVGERRGSRRRTGPVRGWLAAGRNRSNFGPGMALINQLADNRGGRFPYVFVPLR